MLQSDVINELQDMRYLTWSRSRKSSGTAGSYLKAYEVRNGKKIYYKLSCFDSVKGITGYECVNELIVDRLLTILGIEHLHYKLIHAMIDIDGIDYDTYICASDDFKEKGESKIALDDYYDLWHDNGETVLDFCERMGWDDYIYTMFVVDYLILNRDRHGANIEIIKKPGDKVLRPAPLFDHGLSLLFSCHDEKTLDKFDVMADLPVQSYAGTDSAYENLMLIPDGKRPDVRGLEERDRSVLFTGLDDVLDRKYRDRIWEMIWSRWCKYENM